MLRGVKTKVFHFTLRLSYSSKAVHRAFATQGEDALLEVTVGLLYYQFRVSAGGTPGLRAIRPDPHPHLGPD
jgi:hypothetical protein